MNIAIVTWGDAWHTADFQSLSELDAEESEYVITSIGHFIKETPKHVYVAMDFEGTGEGSYREVRRIRKETIKEWKVVEV